MPRKPVPTTADVARALGDDFKMPVRDSLIRSVRTLSTTRDKILADAQRAAAQLDERIQVITSFSDELRELPVRPQRERRRSHAKPRNLDSWKIAGRSNVALVEKTLAARGKATQRELADATGKNSGTITHALRALSGEKPPRVRPTGSREHGSAEWEHITTVANGNGARARVA